MIEAQLWGDWWTTSGWCIKLDDDHCWTSPSGPPRCACAMAWARRAGFACGWYTRAGVTAGMPRTRKPALYTITVRRSSKTDCILVTGVEEWCVQLNYPPLGREGSCHRCRGRWRIRDASPFAWLPRGLARASRRPTRHGSYFARTQRKSTSRTVQSSSTHQCEIADFS